MSKKDSIETFHDSNIFTPTRTIFIGSEESSIEFGSESGVDSAMSQRVIKNLHILESMGKDPITILMNNYGGDVNHGLAIYDAIRACKSEVIIKVFGGCMSMGSIILQAGDKRIMSPQSSQMIHYGFLGIAKEAKTVYKITEEMKRIDAWMEQMYLEKIWKKQPNFTLKKLQKMLDHDTFLTAEQSVELGLADSILESSEE